MESLQNGAQFSIRLVVINATPKSLVLYSPFEKCISMVAFIDKKVVGRHLDIDVWLIIQRDIVNRRACTLLQSLSKVSSFQHREVQW